jgi:hypothetical protein
VPSLCYYNQLFFIAEDESGRSGVCSVDEEEINSDCGQLSVSIFPLSGAWGGGGGRNRGSGPVPQFSELETYKLPRPCIDHFLFS